MKAFILAAGQGTRLQPLTYDTPKPMLPVLNRPVLQHIIEHLVAQGVTQIMINPGYKGEQIESYFGDGRQFGVSIVYLPEMVEQEGEFIACPKGSASTLAIAQQHFQFFDEPVLVLCGDAIIDIDVTSAMRAHRAANAMVSVCLQEVDASVAHKYGIARVDGQNMIEDFIEKPRIVSESRCLANTGLYIFEPAAIEQITKLQGMDIGSDLLPRLIKQNQRVAGLNIPYRWLDIGTVDDYKRINHLLHQEQTQGTLGVDTVGSKNITVGSCCQLQNRLSAIKGRLMLGNGCLIGDGVDFYGDVIVSNNCVLGQDSRLTDCIIGAYTHVPPGSQLKNCILTRNWLVTFDSLGRMDKQIQLNSGCSRPLFDSNQIPWQLRQSA